MMMVVFDAEVEGLVQEMALVTAPLLFVMVSEAVAVRLGFEMALGRLTMHRMGLAAEALAVVVAEEVDLAAEVASAVVHEVASAVVLLVLVVVLVACLVEALVKTSRMVLATTRRVLVSHSRLLGFKFSGSCFPLSVCPARWNFCISIWPTLRFVSSLR